MVKWLEEIEVAEAESQNHYHFMDNRVLPSHVDESLAKEEGIQAPLRGEALTSIEISLLCLCNFKQMSDKRMFSSFTSLSSFELVHSQETICTEFLHHIKHKIGATSSLKSERLAGTFYSRSFSASDAMVALKSQNDFYGAGWWFKPDFIINELNINSAITSPAHEEAVPYAEKTVIKGYAYAGIPLPQVADQIAKFNSMKSNPRYCLQDFT